MGQAYRVKENCFIRCRAPPRFSLHRIFLSVEKFPVVLNKMFSKYFTRINIILVNEVYCMLDIFDHHKTKLILQRKNDFVEIQIRK